MLPPRCAGFGDIEVLVRDDVGLRVRFGHFTQTHFDFDGPSLLEDPDKEVHRTIGMAADLVDDAIEGRIVFFSGPLGVGGYFPRGRPGLLLRLLPKCELWTWSGPCPDAAREGRVES